MNQAEISEPEERKPEEDDDFFGDQSDNAFTEADIRNREVEFLRREHLTTGIREGVMSSHEAYLQEGFDEGFGSGARAAAEPGFLYVPTCKMVFVT